MMQSPEAMMMGSPATSPSSPGAHGMSPFLPAYLMGDQTPATASPGRGLWSAAASMSPPKAAPNKSGSWPSPWTSPPPAGKADTSVFQTPRSEARARDVIGGRGKEKLGAPPVTGLLETLQTSVSHTPDTGYRADISIHNASHLGTSFAGTPSAAYTPGSMLNTTADTSQYVRTGRKTPPSPAQLDPFYTQGDAIGPDDELDETWVTVFGFPPAATSFILQQFSQYGNIVKHVIATEGNWMHLHFQSRLQAKKALSKNGKIFGNSIMIGVSPCIDKAVMEDRGADDSILKTSTMVQHQNLQHDTTLDRTGHNMSRHGSVRPLTAAYKAAVSEHDVIHKSNMPQKNTNMVSKAMDYMFGW